MTFKKAVPILVVDEIETTLPFWVDALGFEKTVEVPDDGRLSFVILNHGEREIMLQTRASIEKEIEEQGAPPVMATAGTAIVYFDVDDLDALRKRVEAFEVLVAKRETPYGAEELWMREPGGHLLGFAQFK